MASLIRRFRSHSDVPQPVARTEAAPISLRQILVPLAAAQFLASYDSSSMNVAISNIVADLDTTVTGVQTAISLFTLTMAALMIPGSKLTDIWGRKHCFILGLTIYGTGALITALAPALAVMIVGFSLLEGVGSALMIPPIYILVTILIPDLPTRAKAFAIVSAMAGLGSACGPLLGGLITTTISWRASFAGEVVAIAAIIYLSQKIPESKPETSDPLDITGTVLSAGGLVFVVLGILQAGTYGWLQTRKDFVIGDTVLLEQGDISPVVLFIGVGVLLLLLFALHTVRSERRGREPLLPSRLFRSRVTVLGLITQNSQWFIMIGTFFVVSLFLQVSRGYSAVETGLALTPATAGILLSSARAETLVKKYSQRTIIRSGFLITLAGVLVLVLVTSSTASILLFAIPLFVIGFGAGIMLTASVNIVQSSASEADQGAISGLSRSVSNLGSSMGTAVAGAILISALIAGGADLTRESTVLTPDQQAQVSAGLEKNATAVSDAKVQEILEGQPPAVVDEVTRINAEARDRALGLALLSVAVIGLVGLGASFLLPASTSAEAATGPPKRPA